MLLLAGRIPAGAKADSGKTVNLNAVN